MLKFLKNLFSRKGNKLTLEDIWLSQSSSLEDLERRQQLIARGQAPWNTPGV